jgi:hypothetical protein
VWLFEKTSTQRVLEKVGPFQAPKGRLKRFDALKRAPLRRFEKENKKVLLGSYEIIQ